MQGPDVVHLQPSSNAASDASPAVTVQNRQADGLPAPLIQRLVIPASRESSAHTLIHVALCRWRSLYTVCDVENFVMENTTMESPYLLVGRIINAWSLAELRVDEAIAEALELKKEQSVIILKSIGIERKIKVLRNLVKLLLDDEYDEKYYLDSLKELYNKREIRNTIAHRPFFPTDEGNAVRFVIFEYKDGEFQIPDFDLTEEEFSNHYIEIHKLADDMVELRRKFVTARSVQSLASVLAGTSPNPFMGLFGNGWEQFRHPMPSSSDSIDSTTPIPQKHED